ncbi:phosphoglycolate phosphatase [Vibrio sp. HA2012]|uniref:phosphoglycolate phosphatase n=1 Tax=Vibrio sp. HA2012 TaxID=1971595 RepID=UPI000C2B939F|nr:phosphoglycolate phosphatase [Vibrio sp. HA2012]PJC85253.1 phosphoglycolate phosphatase [Vibrio sp. HA2012]
MSLEKIKLIAFDLDGTLLDSVPDLALAVDQSVQALGYDPVSEDQVREWVGNGADILLGRALSRSLTVDPAIDPEVQKKARELFNKFYAECGHALSNLYPTVKETLDKLYSAGYKLAVVTNKPGTFVPEILQQHHLSDLFVDVIGGEDFPLRKPDPMALNWLLDKHGLSAEEMLMVGDSKNDVLAAKNACCPSFALTYGYNHGEPIENSEPDYIADEMAELLTLLTA